MKAITIVFVTLATLLAVSLIAEAGPPMPPNMPEELIPEFNSIVAAVETLSKDANGVPQFTDDLIKRMDALKKSYEDKTGLEWPKPPGPPPTGAPAS